MCTLFCLVDIKKRSFLTSGVFWLVFWNASSHLCFRFFWNGIQSTLRNWACRKLGSKTKVTGGPMKNMGRNTYLKRSGGLDLAFPDHFFLSTPHPSLHICRQLLHSDSWVAMITKPFFLLNVTLMHLHVTGQATKYKPISSEITDTRFLIHVSEFVNWWLSHTHTHNTPAPDASALGHNVVAKQRFKKFRRYGGNSSFLRGM